MNIEHKIIDLFKEHQEFTIKELSNKLSVSNQSIHKIVKKLVESKFLLKFGSSPKTIYKLNKSQHEKKISCTFSNIETQFLNDHFLLINENGIIQEATLGFSEWCYKRKLPIQKTLQEFIQTKSKYNQYFNENGCINGFQKLKNTAGINTIGLDDLWYFDFYAIERFGKTKLGTLLHYAKQGQSKILMLKLIKEIKTKMDNFIKNNNFDAVCFIPPTIKRETQIIKYIEQKLTIELPNISIVKINNIIPIPQKSLSSINERVNNAEHSFFVHHSKKYKSVLLIDDAVGSGATMNQISLKIKQKKIATMVIGMAIVGSFKGFDVITDV